MQIDDDHSASAKDQESGCCDIMIVDNEPSNQEYLIYIF